MTKRTAVPHPGLRVRDLRKRRGLTLDQLSAQAELSKGYLSRFERGEKTLSVAALIRLGAAMDVSVGTLLGEDINPEDFHIVRADETPGLVASKEDGLHVFHSLSGEFEGQIHSTFILDVPVNKPHTSSAFHGGRELLFVLQGQININLGREAVSLNQGDYLEFPGNVPHTIVSPSMASRVLLVIVDVNGNAGTAYVT